MAREPGERYVSAQAMAEDLERFLADRTILARRSSTRERAWRWCRRNPAVASLAGLAATLTMSVAIVSAWATYHNRRLASMLAVRNAETNRNVIRAYTNEASAQRQARRVGQRFDTLGTVERAMALAATVGISEAERFTLRNEATAAMAFPDLRVALELDVPKAKENGFAMDPAFKRYAFRLDDGIIIIRRLADGVELLRLQGLPPAKDSSPAGFSLDGRYLAITSAGRDVLQVWDLQEGRVVLTEREMHPANVNNWSFRSGGRELALGRKDNSIVVYDLPSGKLLRRWTGHPGAGWTLAYSPDGFRLAIHNGNATNILASDSGRLLARLTHPADAHHFAWNPRRPNILAVSCDNGVIYVWNVDTSRQTAALRGAMSTGVNIAFHPGGELLAGRGWERMLRIWDTRTGRQVLSQPSAWSATLEFDRSGHWLSVDATLEKARVLELAGLDECRTLVAEPFNDNDRHGALAIDQTGHRAVTTGPAVTVWDLLTGAVLARLPVAANANRALFDRLGRRPDEGPLTLHWPVTPVARRRDDNRPAANAKAQGHADRLRHQPGRLASLRDDDMDTQGWPSPRHGRPARGCARLADRRLRRQRGNDHPGRGSDRPGTGTAQGPGASAAWIGGVHSGWIATGHHADRAAVPPRLGPAEDSPQARRAQARLGPPPVFGPIESPAPIPAIPKPFRVDPGQLDSWLKKIEQAPTRDAGFPADVFAPPRSANP